MAASFQSGAAVPLRVVSTATHPRHHVLCGVATHTCSKSARSLNTRVLLTERIRQRGSIAFATVG